MTQRLRQSDQDSRNQDGAPEGDSPPTYESLEMGSSANMRLPQKPTDEPGGNDNPPPQQALLYTWNNCEFGEGPWGLLIFEMTVSPRHHTGYHGRPWAAGLKVKCRDVPRLMREGFFWLAENILPEEGYVSHSTTDARSGIGFVHKRVWSLTNKSNGETPLWVAHLEVLLLRTREKRRW